MNLEEELNTLISYSNSSLSYEVKMTDSFSDFIDCVESYYGDVDNIADSVLATIENICKKYSLNECNEDIVAILYMDDDHPYMYVENIDIIFCLAILPVGDNYTYRLAAVTNIL